MTFDFNGYPTDETLDKIATCSEGTYKDLIEFVRKCWAYPNYVSTYRTTPPGDPRLRYVFITGGWSGNEDLISALKRNQMFWLMCWVSSDRAGRHEFEVEE